MFIHSIAVSQASSYYRYNVFKAVTISLVEPPVASSVRRVPLREKIAAGKLVSQVEASVEDNTADKTVLLVDKSVIALLYPSISLAYLVGSFGNHVERSVNSVLVIILPLERFLNNAFLA